MLVGKAYELLGKRASAWDMTTKKSKDVIIVFTLSKMTTFLLCSVNRNPSMKLPNRK